MPETSVAVEMATILAMEDRAAARIEEFKRAIEIQELLISELKDQRVAIANRPRSGVPGKTTAGKPSAGNNSKALYGETLLQEAVKVLKHNGTPMRLSEIAAQITANGFIPRSGKSMLNAVFVVLRRRGEGVVEKVSRGTYALK